VKNISNGSSLIPMVDYKSKAVGNNNAQAAAESLMSDMPEHQRERLLERRAREEKVTGLSKAATRTASLRRHTKETFSTAPAPFESSRAVDWATSNGVGGAVAASVTQHPTSLFLFVCVCVCVCVSPIYCCFLNYQLSYDICIYLYDMLLFFLSNTICYFNYVITLYQFSPYIWASAGVGVP
jgi:hypothetical protein